LSHRRRTHNKRHCLLLRSIASLPSSPPQTYLHCNQPRKRGAVSRLTPLHQMVSCTLTSPSGKSIPSSGAPWSIRECRTEEPLFSKSLTTRPTYTTKDLGWTNTGIRPDSYFIVYLVQLTFIASTLDLLDVYEKEGRNHKGRSLGWKPPGIDQSVPSWSGIPVQS
jgi:hypothetical protein